MMRSCLLFVATSLLYGTCTGLPVETPTPKVIFWVRKVGDIKIHESVVIDEKERTILMISSEAYKNNQNNSLALHDYQTGNVALRDFDANLCFVGKIQTPDFEDVKVILENREGKELPLQDVKDAHVNPKILTSSELGPRLSHFCEGVPALWFDIEQKRRLKRNNSGERLACIACTANMQIPNIVATWK
ncbi:uncharacterized protein LOC135481053 [Liolophura sinensis]|uniref:uncharacterized protein LOC135481053 n=1 Tax=Liolophura sinensis TaxID=3198878 RepID=UPI0031584714